jgi:carbon-monoxide dehydrogenase large subunit
MKANIYPDDVLVLWASKRCGRPVKWTATRSESLLLDNHARDQLVHAELALDANGKFLAIRSSAYQALGAYWWGAATAPLFWSLMFIPSLYDVQTIHVSTSAVFTNTAPTSVYRGAGRPEAIYLIERLVEQAARLTGIDRVELRRRNLIKPEALPYHTPTHHNYDSGEFEKLMDQCLKLADWNGFLARRKDSERRGKRRGRAVTPYIELGGVFNERMEIRFDPGGMVTIIAARIRTDRDTPPPSRSLSPNGWACRSRRSITSRAIPRRSRSAAAPSPRAAPWSAATGCASRPTRSSPAARRWRAR